MIILCKIGDIETAVVGYGPGKAAPLAIVPWLDRDGNYVLRAVPLSECKIQNMPAKLRKKLDRIRDKRHEHAVENTRQVASGLGSGLGYTSI
jgi:hypothetical protein